MNIGNNQVDGRYLIKMKVGIKMAQVSSQCFLFAFVKGETLTWNLHWETKRIPTPSTPSVLWDEREHSVFLRSVGKAMSLRQRKSSDGFR